MRQRERPAPLAAEPPYTCRKTALTPAWIQGTFPSPPPSEVCPVSLAQVAVRVGEGIAAPGGILEWIKGLGPSAVGLAALWYSYRQTSAMLQDKQNEEERREIRHQLDVFYGPLRQLIDISRELHDLFVSNREKDFRTLTALVEGESFTGNDKALLDAIVRVTKQADRLVSRNEGLGSERLRSVLARASAHWRVLHLAHEGKLVGDSDRFTKMLYPRTLLHELDEEIDRLRKRLASLGTESRRPRTR